MSAEVGGSDWSQRLGDVFSIRQRVPLSVVGDIVPVAVLEDLTSEPYARGEPWAFGQEAIAGAGTYAGLYAHPHADVAAEAVAVVERIIIQPGAACDITVAMFADPGMPALSGAVTAGSTSPYGSQQNARVVIGYGSRVGVPGITTPLFRMYSQGTTDPVFIDDPFVCRKGVGVYVHIGTAAVSARFSIRGRLYRADG